MSDIKSYVFAIKQYGKIIDRVTLVSDHPHERDFIRKAESRLADIYGVESKDVTLDVSDINKGKAVEYSE